ncbi:MAG: NADH-quinone oxidoreductase subunit C [Alphaproteobacteria bacterium]|nr:MAG: NADH-quinone oxidoreductase subunit C [Alphaproteobacteria bacterium]
MHSQLAETLNKAVPGCNAKVNEAAVGDKSITIEATHILDVCRTMKNCSNHQFNVLQVITGTDYPDRIELSYILASFTKNLEMILKVNLPRGDKFNLPKINSVTSIWRAADFQERETFDMLGVEFVGHPDPRRILCPYDWDGHPLRKDYVVQEKYLDMVVNPPGKINTDDHMFGKRLKEELGDPKRVSASWKDKSEDAETEAKDGE